MAVADCPIGGHLVGTSSQQLRKLLLWQLVTPASDFTAEGEFGYDSNTGDKRVKFRDNSGVVAVPRLDRDEPVVGEWSFAPTTVRVPFSLNANAQGQKVIGLNADQLEGLHGSDNATASTVAQRYTDGRVRVGDPVENADAVSLQYLDAEVAGLTIDASQVTTGLLALARGGTNKDLSAGATGGLIWKDADSLEATAALTGVLLGNGASAPSAEAQLAVVRGGTGASTASGARSNLDVLWADDVRGLLNTRSPRGGLWADVNTTTKLTGTSGVNFGTGDFTISVTLKRNDYTIGAGSTILWESHASGNNRVQLLQSPTTNTIILRMIDSGGVSTDHQLTADVNFVNGEVYVVTVTADRDGLATLYLNGISDRDKSGSGVTVSISSTSAIDIGSGNAQVWRAMHLTSGVYYALRVFNYPLSAAEALRLAAHGDVDYAQMWGTIAASYTSDFTAGADSFTGVNATVTGNNDAVNGVDDVLSVTATGGSGLHRAGRNTTTPGEKRWRVAFDYYIPATNVIVVGVRAGSTANTTGEAVLDATTVGSWASAKGVIYIPDQTATTLFFSMINSSGSATLSADGEVFYLKNVVITPVGALLDLDFENANPAVSTTVRDRSTNDNHGTAASTVTQVSVSRQINTENLALSGTANQVLYRASTNLVTGVTNNGTATAFFLTQTSAGAPVWTDLYGASPTWTGNHTFDNPVVVATPTLDTHAATKAYVDTAASGGLRVLEECVVATTANITLSGEQTIDGVLTSADRVLVKNQTTTSENGIYVSAAGAWSRATDADTAAEITNGAYTFITSGTVNAGTSWVQNLTVTTIDTDPVQWGKFFQQAAYVAGTGIDITGLTISIDLASSLDWTGAHTFTSASGVALEPHGTSAGNTTELRLLELAANGTNYVGFKAPDTIAANQIWTLPSTDGGADYYLTTDGAGVLVFAQISSGHISNVDFVESVTGTADRITVGGTGINPTVDIASTYVGQASITTLGTITTGTWNATAIGPTFGGTGFTTWTAGDLLYANGTNTLAKRAIGNAGRFLQSIGGFPNWSNYNLPTTVTTNQIFYASSSTAIAGLASTANRVLTTDGSGVVAWNATLPTGLSVAGDTNSKVTKIRWFNVGDGAASTITLTHNYATRDVAVILYENGSEFRQWTVAITRPTTNTVQIEFTFTPTLNQFRACVIAEL